MLTIEYLRLTLNELDAFPDVNNQVLCGTGYDGVIEILDNLRSVAFPCAVLENGGSGSCQLYDGPVDTYTQSVWIMGRLGRGEDEAALYAAMKQLSRKVTAKILADSYAGIDGVKDIDWNRYTYLQRYGGPNARGWELVFTFKENFSLRLEPEDLKPRLSRVADFLYGVDFYRLDYDHAEKYFREHGPAPAVGACTSVHAGDFFGGNLDWFYDNGVEFVVRTKGRDGLFNTLGVAGIIPGLVRQAVERGENTQMHKLIPFFINDGTNEAGVYCKVNVVPNDKGTTTRTVPEDDVLHEICSTMLVRFVLDRFATAAEAVNYLQQHVCVYNSKKLQDMGFEAHWMIADRQHSYVVEIVNNHIVANELAVLTNFFIDGVTFNEDGTVYTPADVADGHFASDNGITEHGSGLERFNLAVSGLAEAGSKAGMRALMNALLYSKTYLSAPVVADPLWHTEYVGNLTVDSPAEDFADVEARYAEIFSRRDRDIPETDVRTWHTSHSSVYDSLGKLYIVSQEDTSHEFVFEML